MEVVVSKHLQDIINPTDENKYYYGYVDSQEKYAKFITDLKASGFSFSTRTSYGRKGEKIFFSFLNGSVAIPFFGSPFCIEKSEHLQCSQGKNYFKKKKEPDDLSDHPSSVKRQFLMQRSKKIGCPAYLSVKCIRVFLGSEYSLQKQNTNDMRKVLKKLKEDMAANVLLKSTLRYVIVVSPAAEHTHATLSSNLKQTLYPKLKSELNNMVKINVCCVKTMKFHLKELVQKMVEEDNIPQEFSSGMLYEPAKEKTCLSPRDVPASTTSCDSAIDGIKAEMTSKPSSVEHSGNMPQKLREGLKTMVDYSYLLKDDTTMLKMINSVNENIAEMKSKLPTSNEGLILENSQKHVQRSRTAVKSKYLELPRNQRKKKNDNKFVGRVGAVADSW